MPVHDPIHIQEDPALFRSDQQRPVRDMGQGGKYVLCYASYRVRELLRAGVRAGADVLQYDETQAAMYLPISNYA